MVSKLNQCTSSYKIVWCQSYIVYTCTSMHIKNVKMYFVYFIANSTNQFITLEFRSLNTECSYDYVFVYDGDSFNSPLLGSFSGKNQPQSVLASSGFVSI